MKRIITFYLGGNVFVEALMSKTLTLLNITLLEEIGRNNWSQFLPN